MQNRVKVGKNMEKGGFRESNPGHGCKNRVIFTQVCKDEKSEHFIITHKMKHFALPYKKEHLRLVFQIREVLFQFKGEAE